MTPFKIISLIIVFSIQFFNQGFAHYDFKVRYGDSQYVMNELIYIFGVGIVPILEESILDNRALFGGYCDPYSVSWKQSTAEQENSQIVWVSDKPLEVCKRGISELKNQPIATPSTLRTAWSYKICELITSDNKYISYALEHHKIKDTSNEPEQLLKVYKLFYPAKDEDIDLLENLRKMKIDNLMNWPLIFRTLCASEQWQRI